LRMGPEASNAAYTLRDFLYDRVYESDVIKGEFRKAKKILKDLYEYYMEHIEEVFEDIPAEKKLNRNRMVCDFIAGMTDSFALMTYERLFLPQQWTVV
jgi:dGTPase